MSYQQGPYPQGPQQPGPYPQGPQQPGPYQQGPQQPGPFQQGAYPPEPGGQWGHPQQYGQRPRSSAGKRFGGYLLEIVLAIVTLGIGWLIWSFVVWSDGKTPAKSLLGMRVVKADTGQVATWGDMALRELVGKWLLGSFTFGITTLVSCFMILGQDAQGIWDKIANTIVVDEA
jgi:hypothetical protein